MTFCGRGKALHFLAHGTLSNFCTNVPFHQLLSGMLTKPFI
jgi:hypothetical protein